MDCWPQEILHSWRSSTLLQVRLLSLLDSFETSNFNRFSNSITQLEKTISFYLDECTYVTYMQQPSKNGLICIYRIFIGHHKSWKGYITGSLAQSGQINFHSPRVFDFRSLDFKDSNSKFWRRWLLRLLWSFSKSPFLRFLNVTKIRNEELETWDLAKTKLKVQNNPGNHFKWPHKIQKWTWPHKRTKLSSPKIIKNQNLTSEYRQLIPPEIIICMIFCIRSENTIWE